MDPFLKLNINQGLDRIQTESYESYMQRLDVLKAVAKWDEIKCRERDDASGGAEARTRMRHIDKAATRATIEECSGNEDDSEEEVDDSVSIHSPVFYG